MHKTKPEIPEDSNICELAKALVCLSSPDESMRFLKDLTTPGELQALAERWRVACLLADGEKSYREISEDTGVSTATVTRVARFLFQEKHKW